MDTNITTLIFDCFGVVCSPVLNGWYQKNRVKKGFIDENIENVFRKFDLGILSEDDILEYFLQYNGVNSTKEELRAEIDNYLKINRDLVNTIEQLKKKGFKTVLLSNANASFFERKVYVLYPEFKNLFDEIVISSQIGIAKPDKEIYLYTLKKINSKPEETLFIDDSKQNVESTASLGMKGFLFTDTNSFLNYLKGLGISL